MNTEVSKSEIDRYQRDGFLSLGKFLDPGELAMLRSAIDDCLSVLGKQKLAGGAESDFVERDSYYDRVFLQRINLWKINETIAALFRNPQLGEMLCKLASVSGIRIWHDQTLQKQPWANPTAWHLDNPYWSFHSRQAISIWIALDDATLRNGCVHYLPGTHKDARFDNVDIGDNMDALFRVYHEFKNIEPVAIEMKAGEAAVHNGLTVHGAGPNMTPYWRRAMTCAYMPDGARFNGVQNILSEDQVSKLKVGDLLDDDEQNPLVWSC